MVASSNISLDGKSYANSTLSKCQGVKMIRKKVMHGFCSFIDWNPFYL